MPRSGAGYRSDSWTEGADARLIGLCEEFVRHAEVRTVEGDRLDGLPWSNEVNAGYVELNRDAQGHGVMLADILAIAPRTIQGLVAKARVIARHHQDPEAEPIPSSILADDVLRLHHGIAEDQAEDGARAGACHSAL